MADPASDAEMRALAEREFHCLKERLPDLEHELKILLLPKDEADARNAILEVRAGTGGAEAALFAADLLRMYQRFAALQGRRFAIIDAPETELSGSQQANAHTPGPGVVAPQPFAPHPPPM